MNVLPREALGGRAPEQVHFVGFRPEKARLLGKDEQPAARELVLPGEMLAREMLGDQVLYKLRTDYGTVNVKDFSGGMLEYGAQRIAVPYPDVACFDEGERLIGYGMAWEALAC